MGEYVDLTISTINADWVTLLFITVWCIFWFIVAASLTTIRGWWGRLRIEHRRHKIWKEINKK